MKAENRGENVSVKVYTAQMKSVRSLVIAVLIAASLLPPCVSAGDARIACWINKGFCALALGNDKSCWRVGWTYGNGANSDGAKNYALEDCRNRTTGAHIALSLSSDGQYIWDEKEHTIVIDNKGNIYDGRGNLITPTPAPDASASAHPSASPNQK
jgi:hypothetical protein